MEHTITGDTLELSGALDVRCTAELRVLVYGLLAMHPGDVHVDIRRVDSVDMTTLKLLAVANRAAERQGHRVLHLSHLRSLLAVEPAEPAEPATSEQPTGV